VVHLRYPGRLRHLLRSTNLERSLGEVKRRTRVIRRFTARAVSQPPLGGLDLVIAGARGLGLTDLNQPAELDDVLHRELLG
jgi:hypothetical protein